MLTMRIDVLVAAIVRQELQGKGRDNEALHFHFDLRMGYTEYKVGRGLHLLYHLLDDHSYISVFSAVTPNRFDKIEEIKEWKHEVTHDSCWREMDVFSRVYFEMAYKIQDMIKEDDHKSGLHDDHVVAPHDMNEYNSFPLFGVAYDWQKVEVTHDPSDDNRYRKIVKVIS